MEEFTLSLLDERYGRNEVRSSLPYELSGSWLAVGILLDERRGDDVAKVIDEVSTVAASNIRVGRDIGHAVLDAVAIYTREFIDSRGADYIAVGSLTQYERSSVRSEHRQILCGCREFRSVEPYRIAGCLVVNKNTFVLQHRSVGIDRIQISYRKIHIIYVLEIIKVMSKSGPH